MDLDQAARCCTVHNVLYTNHINQNARNIYSTTGGCKIL